MIAKPWMALMARERGRFSTLLPLWDTTVGWFGAVSMESRVQFRGGRVVSQ